jgi:type I restriction enzyme S subunit
MSWEIVKLGEVCKVLPGFAFKSSLMGASGIPVLKIKNINDNLGVDTQDCQCIDEAYVPEKLAKFFVKKGDILLAMTGATAGKFGRISTEGRYLLNQRVAKIIPVKADANYIWSCLSDSAYRNLLYNMGQGAAQPNVSGGQIEALEIPLPPLFVQQKIAGILSAYDDLIDNNRKRIALLEKAARLLYEEWFVRLQFPGHEHTPVVDGVPQGWSIKRLDEVAEVNARSLKNNFQGEIEYIDISAVSPGVIDATTLYEFADAPGRARRVVRHGDIIWSCVRPNRKSYAVIWEPKPNLIASTGFAVLSPVGIPTSFLVQAVTTDAFVGYLNNNARGAAYPAVTAKDFEAAKLLIPSQTLVDAFEANCHSILSQVKALGLQTQKLQTARDLLLPRLMSGELAV